VEPGGKLVLMSDALRDNNLFAVVSQIMNDITVKSKPTGWLGNYGVCRTGKSIQSSYDIEVYSWFTKEKFAAEYSRIKFRERLDSGLAVRNAMFDTLHYLFSKLGHEGIKPETLVNAKESAQGMDSAIKKFVMYMKRDMGFMYVHRDGIERYEYGEYLIAVE